LVSIRRAEEGKGREGEGGPGPLLLFKREEAGRAYEERGRRGAQRMGRCTTSHSQNRATIGIDLLGRGERKGERKRRIGFTGKVQ